MARHSPDSEMSLPCSLNARWYGPLFSGGGGVHVGVGSREAHDGGKFEAPRGEGQAAKPLPDGSAHEGRQPSRTASRRPGAERCKVRCCVLVYGLYAKAPCPLLVPCVWLVVDQHFGSCRRALCSGGRSIVRLRFHQAAMFTTPSDAAGNYKRAYGRRRFSTLPARNPAASTKRYIVSIGLRRFLYEEILSIDRAA